MGDPDRLPPITRKQFTNLKEKMSAARAGGSEEQSKLHQFLLSNALLDRSLLHGRIALGKYGDKLPRLPTARDSARCPRGSDLVDLMHMTDELEWVRYETIWRHFADCYACVDHVLSLYNEFIDSMGEEMEPKAYHETLAKRHLVADPRRKY